MSDPVLDALEVLVAAYPRYALSDATVQVYRQMLGGLPSEVLLEAVNRHVKTGPFFPSIAELLTLARAVEVERRAWPHPEDAWEYAQAAFNGAAAAMRSPDATDATRQQTHIEFTRCLQQLADGILIRVLAGMRVWFCLEPKCTKHSHEWGAAERAQFLAAYQSCLQGDGRCGEPRYAPRGAVTERPAFAVPRATIPDSL